MMQKRLYIFCFALLMICFSVESRAQRGRTEIAIGYGYWSIYTFVNGTPFNQSSGTPALTIRHYFTKDVTLGMGFSSENINNWGSFTTFAPELTVCYLDTRHDRVRVRLYGAVSYGISYFNDNQIAPNHADESGAKATGFQATPFGIRMGRQVALFAEVGIGYKGTFHVGADFRFPRVLAKNRHREE